VADILNPSLKELVQKKGCFIFDLFHTLTTVESMWAKIPITCEMLGVSKEKWHEQLLEKSLERLIGLEKDPYTIIRKMAHAIDPAISEDKIRAATESRIKRFESALVNIPLSTQETIKKLKSQNKKIGLISNADVGEKAGWNKSPIAPYFDSVIFSCDVGYAKPDKRIYEISLKELNELPENCIFVGDGGSSELRAAKSFGMTTVMVVGVIRDIWPDKIEERKEYADFVIENIAKLIE
jgi:putative hydrolase of the HAD superfamily